MGIKRKMQPNSELEEIEKKNKINSEATFSVHLLFFFNEFASNHAETDTWGSVKAKNKYTKNTTLVEC